MGELKHLCKPIGKPQLIPKPLEEEVPISNYLASWDALEKSGCSWTQDLDPAFPRYSVDIPANCQATSPALACHHLSDVLLTQSPAQPHPGSQCSPKLCLGTVQGSAEASNSHGLAGRQLDSWQSMPIGKGAKEWSMPFTGGQFICTGIATNSEI